MNARHQNKMKHPLVTKTAALNRYLSDKTVQARRVVKQGYLYKLLSEGMELWHSVCDLLDGVDTAKKAMRSVYRIQQDAVLAGFMEADNRMRAPADEGRTLCHPPGGLGQPEKEKRTIHKKHIL